MMAAMYKNGAMASAARKAPWMDGRAVVARGRRPCTALLAGICLLIALPSASLGQSEERRVYDLGTATADRVSHPLGVTIAALIKLKLLPRENIDLNAVNTDGSGINAVELRAGELDFAILNGLDAFQAAHGTGSFTEAGPDPSLRLMTNLWTSAFYFVLRPELVRNGTFSDLLRMEEAPRIALGEPGSTTQGYARALFESAHVNVDKAFDLQALGAEQAAEAFIEGEIDGFLLVDESQGAEIAAFLDEAGAAADVLYFEDGDIEAIGADRASPWTEIPVPAGSLPGQAEERAVIGLHNLLCASERAPEDVVHEITRTIFDNLPFLQEMHDAAVGIDLESALDRIVLPVHAGAAAYYREVGVTVPDPEPVRISRLAQTTYITRFDNVQEARSLLNDGTVTILGGEPGQTVTRMVGELATVLHGNGIRVIGLTNPKPVDNIADVLYARGVDSAVVPLDVLAFAARENIYPDLQGKVRYLAELFAEEVHLIAAGDVDDLGDLFDRPVNLGLEGSTSTFTVSLLLDRMNLPVEARYFDQRTALALLKKGELAAAFFVSGKPMPLLAELPADTGLHLLDLPPLDGDAYRAATIGADDYPDLLADGESIETFAVRTGLISYNWLTGNPRYDVLSNFLGAFFDWLPALKENSAGRHPKWQEIDPYREIEGWRRSPAAEAWLRSEGPEDGTADGTDG